MARNQPEEERRLTILAAAKTCFVTGGFAATRMEDIAHAARLSKGGLYFHFKSKNDLMVAVVRRENLLIEQLLTQSDTDEGDLWARVDRMLTTYFQYLVEHLDAAKISQCILDEALRNEAVRSVLVDGEQYFLNRLERLLTRAVERGELPPSLNVSAVARLCMVFIEGAKTKYLHFPDWPWTELLLMVRTLVASFSSAYLSTEHNAVVYGSKTTHPNG
ncbi:MAG: TetR/AcrR family transcriptional regulator [Myxococcales bacterium]|nr:TetR/AcrR family transcriptional regulator [Myxococcales bacterium]